VIVVDSSFLIAFHNHRDSQHSTARVMMSEFLTGKWGRGLLLEYVFLEPVTVMLNRRGFDMAARVGELLLESEQLEFLPCSDFFTETVNEFNQQKNTKLSFADAAICVAARSKAAGRLLTFDAEFHKVPGLQLYPAPQ
jgi:predicted nucleic acid-binding protein